MKQFLFSCMFASILTCHNGNNIPLVNSDSTIVKTDTVPSGNDASKNETLQGEWYLQPVLPSDTAAGKIPTLKFDLKTNRVSGNTGCNSFGGSFMIKGSALSFSPNMISTRMACPGYNEKAFLENLIKTNRYEIKKGVLQLMYNTTILSNWRRQIDTSISKQL